MGERFSAGVCVWFSFAGMIFGTCMCGSIMLHTASTHAFGILPVIVSVAFFYGSSCVPAASMQACISLPAPPT